MLAEAIGGTEEGFVEKMNAKAKELGLTHTFYKNCTGWPDPDQHMCARDIATLAGAIIRTFPDYYHYDSEKTFKYNGIEQGNRNPMVQKGTADGLKDGPYRSRRLRRRRQFKAQRPARDPGAERDEHDATSVPKNPNA